MYFRPISIGKYILLERLAIGGMAEIYRAAGKGASGFKKPLVIKRILPFYSLNKTFNALFEEEAKLSSQLHHANIAQVYDFIRWRDNLLLVMEFIPGKNLREFSVRYAERGGCLSPAMSVFITMEICQGLEYAHTKVDNASGKPLNIIHRDISPQNIMLSYDGGIKIVDFGIAKAATRLTDTKTGLLRGKVAYMSPEQAVGEVLDRRSDIFSLGILLYEMITGQNPFSAEEELASLKRVEHCELCSEVFEHPSLPKQLAAIVRRCLEKNKTHRYQEARELYEALHSYLSVEFPSYSKSTYIEFLQETFQREISDEKVKSVAFHQIIDALEKERDNDEFSELDKDHPFSVNSNLAPHPSSGEKSFFERLMLDRKSRSSTPSIRTKGLSKWVLWVSIMMITGALVNGYFYFIILSKNFLPLGVRKPTTHKEPDRNISTIPEKCKVRIITQPPGALILADGVKQGMSPLFLEQLCRREFSLQLELEGFELQTEKISLMHSDATISRSLTKVPMGILELMLDRKAKIFIRDVLVGEVAANQKFQLSLLSRKKHHIRFINVTEGIDFEEEVVLAPNIKIGRKIFLPSNGIRGVKK